MSDSPGVYDLGEIGRDASTGPTGRSRPAANATVVSTIVGGRQEDLRAGRVVVQREYGPGSARPAVAASASLFVPGTGLMVAGDPGLGLFVLSTLGLVGALTWALLETFDRLLPILGLFELPLEIPALVLVSFYLAAVALHIGGAVQAQALAARHEPPKALHPALTGVASAVVPGWGQLLNGHRARAALFLLGLWLVAGGALLMSPPRHPAMHQLGSLIPVGPASKWGVAVLLTVAALLWALSVYDAVMGAVSRRRR